MKKPLSWQELTRSDFGSCVQDDILDWSSKNKRTYKDAIETALEGLANLEIAKKRTTVVRGERKEKNHNIRIGQKKKAIGLACLGVLEYASQEVIDVHIGDLREHPDHNVALVCVSNILSLRKVRDWWSHRGGTARSINQFFAYMAWLIQNDPDLWNENERDLILSGWKYESKKS